MNRAERRRQKKQAQKAAHGASAMPPAALQQALEMAVQHHTAGRLSEAERIYRHVLQSAPNQPVALHLLGVVAYQTQRYDEAIDLIGKALAIKPDFADAHYNLGNALKGLGKLDDAVTSYKKAVALKPSFIDAHSNLGLALQDLGKLDDAVASFQKALAINPNFAEVHYNLGNALKGLGRLDDAVASYNKAVEIKPDYLKAYSNLGLALQDLGKSDEAVDCYRKALAINPDFAEGHNNLGLALLKLGKTDDAVACYQKALAIRPDFVQAHYNLGNVLRGLGKLDEAVDQYEQALALDPDFTEAYNNLGNAFTDLGQMEEAAACYQKAIAIDPDDASAHSNLIFTHNYTETHTATGLLNESRRYGELVAARARPVTKHKNTPDPDRKLRVGLVSGDFRQHSVSHFLDSILHEVDADELELYAYSNFPNEDDMTAKIRSHVFKFTNVVDVPDEQLAQDIVQDGIDILVDLSGHTGLNRLPLFAWKPAPIQVTWLGYSGTTGVEAIDYILCDSAVIPQGEDSYFTERPWRLADIWLCFSPPDLKIDVDAVPALANGYVTFGSFNNLSKVSRDTMACWAQIVKSVPNSRLLLKSKQLGDDKVRDDVIATLEDLGVDRQQLVLLGETPSKADHFKTYNQVDIALDPFPYAGTTTSVEALWMGTPLLTLKGNSFISHTGESILQNVGLGDWIGETPSHYIEKAVAFAADLPALSALSEALRDRLVASPACDAPRFARNLEAAFRGMWRKWCE